MDIRSSDLVGRLAGRPVEGTQPAAWTSWPPTAGGTAAPSTIDPDNLFRLNNNIPPSGRVSSAG